MEPENTTSAPEIPSNQPLMPESDDSFPPANGAPAPPAPSGIHSMFLGPQGLRAGWSVAIFLVLFAGPITGLNLFVQYMQKVRGSRPKRLRRMAWIHGPPASARALGFYS